MRIAFGLLIVLVFALLGFGLTIRQPAQPGKRPTFFREAKIERQSGTISVKANDPRPLAQAITAINQEYGWKVDYEDPPYTSDFELVDDTDPNWRAKNPSARGVKRIAGGMFDCTIQTDQLLSAGGEASVLRKVVDEYNRSGNPGKFTVRDEGAGRFSIVGSSIKNPSGSDQDVAAVLDTPITLTVAERTADETIELIRQRVSDKIGLKVADGAFGGNSFLVNTRVTVGGKDVPARQLLQETLDTSGNTFIWHLFYNPDRPLYFLNINAATRFTQDSEGARRLLPVDRPSPRRP